MKKYHRSTQSKLQPLTHLIELTTAFAYLPCHQEWSFHIFLAMRCKQKYIKPALGKVLIFPTKEIVLMRVWHWGGEDILQLWGLRVKESHSCSGTRELLRPSHQVLTYRVSITEKELLKKKYILGSSYLLLKTLPTRIRSTVH